jgi:penicillin amidase
MIAALKGNQMTRTLWVLLFLLQSSCAAGRLAGYELFPDYPRDRGEQKVAMQGLARPVHIALRDDGIARIEAQTDRDLYQAAGYLQARDRMFEMDFLRHMAEGRLTEILGNVDMGPKTALETDTFNRFLGFGRQSVNVVRDMEPVEKANLQAFADGVNAWIAEDKPSLEHRLLNVKIDPWRPEDSIAIFGIVMFGLTHNYSREVRRLLIACDAGFDALERVWPTRIDFPETYLPADAVGADRFPIPAAIAPEMRSELPSLCPAPKKTVSAQLPPSAVAAVYNPLLLWLNGAQASNNWTVSGSKTTTGKPFLANDPHMPLLNPPIVWPVNYVVPGYDAAGFVLVGTHRIFVGHNGHVAWGATINNVDLQDLYVEKPAGAGYAYGTSIESFTTRTEHFKIKGGDTKDITVRYSRHGVLLNDIEPFLSTRIPLTALHMVPVDGAQDGEAMARAQYARDGTEYVNAMHVFDSACINWVFADTQGNIGWTSPCRIPIRPSHLGTFPVPGWTSAYEWKGFYPKEQIPHSFNPAQGWIATANNQPEPRGRFPTPYDNDASPPNRWAQIAGGLSTTAPLSITDMTRLQVDVGLSYWKRLRADLDAPVCKASWAKQQPAMDVFCAWDGRMNADSAAASLFILFSNAVLDRALADDVSGGTQGEIWNYLTSVAHIETNLDRLWNEPVTAPVWDDSRTPQKETREDIYRLAMNDSLTLAEQNWGSDPADWAWGSVHPFTLRHFFGGKGGILGRVFNSDPLPGRGAPETVFKEQFIRSDRKEMNAMAGPALRFVADLSDLSRSRYVLSGGVSGWPRSPHYADQLPMWMEGETLPLAPKDAKVAGEIWLTPK